MSNTPELKDSKILIVDDAPTVMRLLQRALKTEGYDILVATSGAVALDMAEEALPDLILLDIKLPDIDGLEVCRRLKEKEATSSIPVIFLTALDQPQNMVQGFRAGSQDYVSKPFHIEEVLARVKIHLTLRRLITTMEEQHEELARKHHDLEESIQQRNALSTERNQLADHLAMLTAREAERWGLEGLIGRSPTMQAILDKIRLLRQSDTIRILITGESGTGKELIARAIHTGSARRQGPFIPVNCAAIPVQLAESLFFGHVRGAFTGADRDRQGYFALAHTGTLFLDEVADLAPELQPKLLRVLEDGVVVPLGSSHEQKIDARIIVASNQDLQTRVAQGAFREDLYFRLRQVAVGVPPLRDRKEDVPLLANHFLQLFAQEMAIPVPQLTDMALTRLQGYRFPGNVRELKNLVEHALLDSRGKDIQAEHLHLLPNLPMGTDISLEKGVDTGSSMSERNHLSGFEPQNELPLNLEEAELLVIKRAVAFTHGNVAAAARLLGTNRTRIYRTLNPEKYKISS